MGPSLNPESRGLDLDIDVAGVLRIRLLDAGERQAMRVARQFGSEPAPTSGVPDLVVRYADRVGGARLRLIGLHDAAWDDAGFYVLARHGRRDARARIPFEALEPGCEVVVERGYPGVPLLVQLVNALMLARDVLPLHAASVELGSRGVAAAGWSKGGKTEAMLGLLRRGAAMVADEWTYVDPDTRAIRGAPGLVRLQDWHLEQLADLRERVPSSALTSMRWARRLQSAHRLIRRGLSGVPGARHLQRAVRLLDEQRHVDVPAELVDGRRRATSEPTLGALLWVVSAEVGATEVRPIEVGPVAERMTFSHQHHRQGLLAAYYQYRFAFPERPSELMETLEARERRLLQAALSSVSAYEVLHPARPRIDEMGDAMARAIA